MVGMNLPRTQIALPAQGLKELIGLLSSLIEEFGNEDDRGENDRWSHKKKIDLS